MCGIVGFISDAGNALYNVMNGLRTLEYRGYDSAGVAFLHNGLQYAKSIGPVANLSNKIDFSLKVKVAIAHSRWATHGKISISNTHPHIVNNIAIVHNGIIDNYQELAANFKMRSETDSEIIAHLIDEAQGDLLQKVQYAVKQLKGSFAILVCSNEEPDRIILASNKSPLVIGKCMKGAVVASDVYALIGHSSAAYFMRDGETAEVSSGNFQVYNSKGNKVKAKCVKIMEKLHAVDTEEFDSFMHKEIFEQPQTIRHTIENNKKLPKIENPILTGCGTSYNACLLAERLGLKCDTILASELSLMPQKLKGRELVAVSQSGETADTIVAMRLAKSQGCKVIAIVNRKNSMMERIADQTFYTYAGQEISVASTKSFVAQIVLLGMLAGIDTKILNALPEQVEILLKDEEPVKSLAQNIYNHPSVFFLGKMAGFPVALEGALKLKEISYIHAEAYPAAEMKHGPIALIQSGTPVLVVANHQIFDKIISNVAEVKSRGAYTVGVSSIQDEHFDYQLNIPETDIFTSMILTTVYFQLVAYYVAKLKGCPIDKPRNLAKSVTV